MQLKKHKSKDSQTDWELLKNNDIIGTISFLETPDFYEILYIEIDRPFRKKGYGKSLIQELIKYAVENSKDEILLEVSSENNSAISLYEKNNFKQYAKRKEYYKNGDDAILMKLKIK